MRGGATGRKSRRASVFILDIYVMPWTQHSVYLCIAWIVLVPRLQSKNPGRESQIIVENGRALTRPLISFSSCVSEFAQEKGNC